MNDLNVVVVRGRIGRDAERRAAGESHVTHFSVAVSLRWKDKEQNQQEQTSWLDVEAWNGLSTIAETHAKKGRKVIIHGRLKQDTWEKDGQKRSKIVIVADHLDIDLPSKSK